MTPVKVKTRIGVFLLAAVVPSPNWPNSFEPHVHTIPDADNAIEWLYPAVIALICDTLLTCRGIGLLLLLLLPNCPDVFLPHAHTVPSDLNANEWPSPADIAITSVSQDTLTGIFLLI